MEKRIIYFDIDGTLMDNETIQNLCILLKIKGFEINILTSRISGLEDSNFVNAAGDIISEIYNDDFGIKYGNLDNFSDIFVLAEKLEIDINNVLFTEGCLKAFYFLKNNITDFILFDDSLTEINCLKYFKLAGQPILVNLDKSLEDYLKEMF